MAENKSASDFSLQIVNQVSAMLAYWNKDQICLFANNAYREWLGKSPEEMIGITMKELLGSLYEKNLPYIKEVLKGNSQTFEREITTPAKHIRHAIISYHPDELNGEVKGFFVHVADVTAMKNLELELKASETKFKQLLETAPDAILIVNTEGKIQIANALCESLFGYKKEELTGKIIELLLPDRLRINHQKLRNNFTQQPKIRPMGEGLELFAKRKNGEEFPIEISLSPLKTKEGMLISASIRDITWKVEKQRELIKSMNVINRQNKQLLNFAHIVSHNLKTQSVNLSSIINLLSDAKSDEEKKQMMEFLKSISTGFADTINNLTEISELQIEERHAFSHLNLHQYIHKCLDTLDINIKSCQAVIVNNVNPAFEIPHHPAYLESIIQNFLTNAIKYRDPARNLIIKLDTYLTDDKVILRIEDNGRGIDLIKNGHKLFGIYQTFHGNADAKGVGLFITKYQVEELGGHIEVLSKEGVGSVFTVYFQRGKKNC